MRLLFSHPGSKLKESSVLNQPQESASDFITVIKPLKGWLSLDLREMWQYRDLLYFLTWRDVKVKYKQTLLGFAWALIVPLANMVVLGTIFGKVAGVSSYGIDPYLFQLAGLVPWLFFANSLTMSGNSLIGNAHLLTKIYLPRVFIPLGICLANFVDYLIGIAILLTIMAFAHIMPSLSIFFIPLLMAIALSSALGMGLILSALNVKYRDIRFAIPFLVQMGMYCSVPISYATVVERLGPWRFIYAMNPMAGVIEGCRWVLFHHEMYLHDNPDLAVPPPWEIVLIGAPVSVLLLIFGLYYFKRMEKMFADLV